MSCHEVWKIHHINAEMKLEQRSTRVIILQESLGKNDWCLRRHLANLSLLSSYMIEEGRVTNDQRLFDYLAYIQKTRLARLFLKNGRGVDDSNWTPVHSSHSSLALACCTLFEIFIFCPKIQLWFPDKVVDFCCGFGLFSCWQLWFHEKNCPKKIWMKISWKCWVFVFLSNLNFWTKIWLLE